MSRIYDGYDDGWSYDEETNRWLHEDSGTIFVREKGVEPSPDGLARTRAAAAEHMGGWVTPNMHRVMTEHGLTYEDLRWRKFPVLDDGFICLVDWMGSDDAVVQAARVSYGRDKRDGEEQEGVRKLLRFMMRLHHTSPFEMCEVKLLVRCPMDVWRQWIRHRTANVNEYSTRYTTAIDSAQKTAPDQWRLQSKSNKQGSSGLLIHTPGAEYAYRLTDAELELQQKARKVYEDRLELGVASEQARKDLPLSTYTEAYWKIDLHNLFHFLDKRMDTAAQLEIRSYANVIGEQIVAKLFPECWQAFLDYKLNAVHLSALEIEMLRGNVDILGTLAQKREGMTDREYKEFEAKLRHFIED